MARTKKPKTGIQPGFPKLAFYIGPTKTINIPSDHYNWSRPSYLLESSELVVLVAEGYDWDYSRREGQYYARINQYYFIPVKALENNIIPITAIHKWKEAYRTLTRSDQKLFTIIERKDIGEEPITFAATA